MDHISESVCLESQCLNVIRGQTSFIDIQEIEFEGDDVPVYSFLMFSWALLSDIDLESEFLRYMGDTRLWVWALWRTIFKLRAYPCQFWF